MRQFVAVLGIMVVLAVTAASSATAVPSDIKLRVEGQAELVSPTAVRLTVAYDCPVGSDTDLSAAVVQPETDSFASAFLPTITCTGRWETIILNIVSPSPSFASFVPGQALATVRSSAGGGVQDFRERSVHIVA